MIDIKGVLWTPGPGLKLMLTVLTSILITVMYVYIGCGKCKYQTVRDDIVDHIVVTFQKLSWSNSKAAGLDKMSGKIRKNIAFSVVAAR